MLVIAEVGSQLCVIGQREVLSVKVESDLISQMTRSESVPVFVEREQEEQLLCLKASDMLEFQLACISTRAKLCKICCESLL